jgi:hypothetical protein
MAGRTGIAPLTGPLDWPFNARYALLSKRIGRHHLLSARYDRFEVDSRNTEEEDGRENGHCLTVAYVFDPGRRWTATLEWLRVTSNSYSRGEYLDRAGPVTDTQVQLAFRYSLGSAPY